MTPRPVIVDIEARDVRALARFWAQASAEPPTTPTGRVASPRPVRTSLT
ncbi:hypothetical protein GOL98_08270 [Streptomyces sp. Z38]|nr:hypothetical protein [Streptomyces sp. Z38]